MAPAPVDFDQLRLFGLQLLTADDQSLQCFWAHNALVSATVSLKSDETLLGVQLVKNLEDDSVSATVTDLDTSLEVTEDYRDIAGCECACGRSNHFARVRHREAEQEVLATYTCEIRSKLVVVTLLLTDQQAGFAVHQV